MNKFTAWINSKGLSSVLILAVVLLVSAFFYPVWTGMSVPYDFWLLHNWLPGWI